MAIQYSNKIIFSDSQSKRGFYREGECDDFCKQPDTTSYVFNTNISNELSLEEIKTYLTYLKTLGLQFRIFNKDFKKELSPNKIVNNDKFNIDSFFSNLFNLKLNNTKVLKSINPFRISGVDSINIYNYNEFKGTVENFWTSISNTRVKSFIIESSHKNFSSDLLLRLLFLKYYDVTSKNNITSFPLSKNKLTIYIKTVKSKNIPNLYNLFLLQLLRAINRTPTIVKKMIELKTLYPKKGIWELLFIVHSYFVVRRNSSWNEYYDPFMILPVKYISLKDYIHNLKSWGIVNSYNAHLKSNIRNLESLPNIENYDWNTHIKTFVTDNRCKVIYLRKNNRGFVTNEIYQYTGQTEKSYIFSLNGLRILKTKNQFKIV